MNANDSSTPAEAVRLLPVLDADRLVADLMTARDHLWDEQSSYENGRVSRWADQDWRCLSVRSPGGDKTRTDAGGAGSAEFADTEWLDHMPYVREILNSIPGPLHGARDAYRLPSNCCTGRPHSRGLAGQPPDRRPVHGGCDADRHRDPGGRAYR